MSITGLHIRERLLKGVRALAADAAELLAERLSPQQAAEPAAAAPTPTQAPPAPAPTPAAAPAPKPAPAAAPTPAPKPAPKAPAESEEDRAAKRKQMVRTGLLRFVDEQGGKVTLHDLHKQSASKFFVSHQAFSEVMEGFVNDGLLEYDPDENIATITASGHAAIQD